MHRKIATRARLVFCASMVLFALLAAPSSSPARERVIPEVALSTPAGTIHVRTPGEHLGEGEANIQARVPGKFSMARLVLLYSLEDRWVETAFAPRPEVRSDTLASARGHVWIARIPHQSRGTRVPYRVRLDLRDGSSYSLPASSNEGPSAAPASEGSSDRAGASPAVMFKGRPSTPLLVTHVIFMMLGIVSLGIALIAAWRYLARSQALAWMRRAVLGGFACLAIGGLLLGMPVEYQVYGTYWEGWPFGRDVTDTKTGLLLVLWLAMIWIRGREIFGKRVALGRPTDRAWAIAVIALTVVTAGLYLIPHQNIKF